MNLDAALIGAIGSLAAVIAFLYLDKGKTERRYQEAAEKKDADHAAQIAAMSKTFSDTLSAALSSHAREVKESDERFTKVINELSSDHQRQEEQIHDRYEKSVEALVREHKHEVSGLVERILVGNQNERDHARQREDRILALSESLRDRARWSRGE